MRKLILKLFITIIRARWHLARWRLKQSVSKKYKIDDQTAGWAADQLLSVSLAKTTPLLYPKPKTKGDNNP